MQISAKVFLLQKFNPSIRPLFCGIVIQKTKKITYGISFRFGFFSREEETQWEEAAKKWTSLTKYVGRDF